MNCNAHNKPYPCPKCAEKAAHRRKQGRKPLSPSGPIKAKKPAAKSAKWYDNKCEELCRVICKIRAKYTCQQCGVKSYKLSDGSWSTRLEWAHRKSRKYKSIKFDPRNYDCLCWGCHAYMTCHPDTWTKSVEARDPGAWDYLNQRLQLNLKVSWPVLYEALKAELELVKEEYDDMQEM